MKLKLNMNFKYLKNTWKYKDEVGYFPNMELSFTTSPGLSGIGITVSLISCYEKLSQQQQNSAYWSNPVREKGADQGFLLPNG